MGFIKLLENFSFASYVCRLLDKLQVVCPNVDYCEEVLARCELEAHLVYRYLLFRTQAK